MRLRRRRRARHRRRARRRHALGGGAVGLPPGRRRSGRLAGRRDGRGRARPAGSRRVAGGAEGMNDTADSFIGKWLQRWPEWRIAEAFVPEPRRRTATGWFALLQELTEAAWGGADPTPGLAKLAWWHEELEGWAKGLRRHPLGQVLQRQAAPWSRLGRALNALPATRGQPVAEAVPALADLARAVTESEAALFAAAPDARRTAGESAVVHLAERVLLIGERGEADWLLDHWPVLRGEARPRRLHAAMLRKRLQALPGSGEAVPLRGWRV